MLDLQKCREVGYYSGMKFLPDSAVLGTLGRIKHASKPRHKKVKGARRVVDSRSAYVGCGGDFRSLEELLAEAKRHAGRAGK